MTKKDLIKKILELGKELEKANGFDTVMIINDMEIQVDNYTKQLPIHNVSKRFDFDKLLQDYRQEFVNGGGYVKSDTFESGTEPYEVFEWFKKKLS